MSEQTGKLAALWWCVQATGCIALFGIACSLFVPAVGRHGPSPMMQTLNNLFQISLAITNYAMESEETLPRSRFGGVGHSWRIELCPQLDRADLARGYRYDATWDSSDNAVVTSQWLPVMTSAHRPRPCKDAKGRGYADFGLITGPGTANPPEGPVTLDFISQNDGLGQTLLVGECSGLQLIWTEPRDPDVSRETIGIAHVTTRKPVSDRILSSYNASGACTLFADGSAKWLRSDMDAKVLAALCTPDGGRDELPTPCCH